MGLAGLLTRLLGRRSAQRVLVTGGARSGKSSYAESLLKDAAAVDYVATGPSGAGDPEWAARVALHRERRPASWSTIESCDLVGLLSTSGPPLLIDCLSLWLVHQCDAAGIWDGEGSELLAKEIDALLHAWQATERTVIAVTNEVGSSIVPETASGRRYRDELGRLNARIAEASDQVWLLTVGRAQLLP